MGSARERKVRLYNGATRPFSFSLDPVGTSRSSYSRPQIQSRRRFAPRQACRHCCRSLRRRRRAAPSHPSYAVSRPYSRTDPWGKAVSSRGLPSTRRTRAKLPAIVPKRVPGEFRDCSSHLAPVGPPTTTMKVSSVVRRTGVVLFSASSNFCNKRARILRASLVVFGDGALHCQWACTTYF